MRQINSSQKSQLLNELKVLQYCRQLKLKMCVEAIDYFEEGEHAFLVCKYINCSLRDILHNSQGMSTATACHFLHQVAYGLCKLHKRGIVVMGGELLFQDAIRVK